MDHVILTVGRNELPVLVAAYRLCALNPQLPRFSVLHSAQTAPEAARVRDALERRLTAEGRIGNENKLHWVAGDDERVDESYPPSIQLAVRKIVASAPAARKPDYSFHLHHTGGTTAMGVYALQELLRRNAKRVRPIRDTGWRVVIWPAGTTYCATTVERFSRRREPMNAITGTYSSRISRNSTVTMQPAARNRRQV